MSEQRWVLEGHLPSHGFPLGRGPATLLKPGERVEVVPSALLDEARAELERLRAAVSGDTRANQFNHIRELKSALEASRAEAAQLREEVRSLKVEYLAAAALGRRRTEELDTLREWCRERGYLADDVPRTTSFDRELHDRLASLRRGSGGALAGEKPSEDAPNLPG